ncbi:shikimate kinase [Spirochaetia bacterium]|nr:shikimate kinase [Spirochaetia bacterium]
MKNIVLMGPKHSGKSTVGKLAAQMLFCPFFDLDTMIEQRSGNSPRELFLKGPEIFRLAEAETLAAWRLSLFETPPLLPSPTALIATGGGIIDNENAMAMLNSFRQAPRQSPDQIILVYLEVQTETAWQRIMESAGHQFSKLPPFLQTEDPEAAHRVLHERRAAAYRAAADITIRADGKSAEENARFLVGLIKN